jgi:small subunit ribosomal protein S9
MDILAKAVGRRKEAVAQVQIKKGTGQFIINNKPAHEYLQNDTCSLLSVKAPFDILLSSSRAEGSVGLDPTTKQTDNLATDGKNVLHDLNVDTIVKVKGGGLMGQSEAIRLGISRAICSLASVGHASNNAVQQSEALTGEAQETELETTPSKILDIRKQLKDKGYLTQDSRVKERRKYGLKKARKASQYHKR